MTPKMDNKIKELRKLRGFTQEQLADALGVTLSQMGKLERGERRLDAHWLERLSKALNCTKGALLGEDTQNMVPVIDVNTITGMAIDAPPYGRVAVDPEHAHLEGLIGVKAGNDEMDGFGIPAGTLMVAQDLANATGFIGHGSIVLAFHKGQRVIRQLRKVGEAWHLQPRSTNPDYLPIPFDPAHMWDTPKNQQAANTARIEAIVLSAHRPCTIVDGEALP